MDIQEINNKHTQFRKKYLESQVRDKEIIEKAIIFFNRYYNLVEHPFTIEDVEKVANFDFAIKMDFLHWTTIDPKTEEEINKFYRNTPFEFFKNLFKNMDVMHYEEVLGRFILPELNRNKTKTVLDYGGGSGYQSILLHKFGYKVTFAEISKLSIEWMKYITKELNLDINIIDLQESKIENNYDSIILKDVLEHVVNPINLLDVLTLKTKNLIITPDKVDTVSDYLPMHFGYKIQNDS